MYKTTLLFTIGVSLALALMPIVSFACACCAEPGTYMLHTGKPSRFELDLLKDLKFDKKAELFMTEAEFDAIKGLDDLRNEPANQTPGEPSGGFDLVSFFTGSIWRFEIRSVGGRKGTLTLPLPAQMVTFKVDIHDQEDRPNGPELYKEFRFKGSVSGGTGIFRSSMIRPTTYFLVFQGRGNGCDNVEDFSHWRLEVNGPKADYAFFGKLAGSKSSM